jgi:MarR family transcriptional regulator, lower aerobic nicotinate degradation pathway regulator
MGHFEPYHVSVTAKNSSPKQLPENLWALTSFLLVKLGKEGSRRSCDALASEGIRLQHYAVLSTLAEFGATTQRELSDRLGFDTSDMVALLDDLSASHYVDRQRDEQDRRRHLVTVTPEGKAGLRRLTRELHKQQDEMLKPLDKHEREVLHKLLERVYADVRERS